MKVQYKIVPEILTHHTHWSLYKRTKGWFFWSNWRFVTLSHDKEEVMRRYEHLASGEKVLDKPS